MNTKTRPETCNSVSTVLMKETPRGCGGYVIIQPCTIHPPWANLPYPDSLALLSYFFDQFNLFK